MELIYSYFDWIILNKGMLIVGYFFLLMLYLVIGLLIIGRNVEKDDSNPTKGFVLTSPLYPLMIVIFIISMLLFVLGGKKDEREKV